MGVLFYCLRLWITTGSFCLGGWVLNFGGIWWAAGGLLVIVIMFAFCVRFRGLALLLCLRVPLVFSFRLYGVLQTFDARGLDLRVPL